MEDHVKIVEGKKYKYERPDGNNFTLRRRNSNTNNWDPVQVNDIIVINYKEFKVLSITPTQVLLEAVVKSKK
mgnify:CR=1 FL=1